jgi:hypothetical protein
MKQHVLAAHLDRLNVNNGDAGQASTSKTGIIYRRTFKERERLAVRDSSAEYRAKSLVQTQPGSQEAVRRRRTHYPYLEKLGNIDSKLVQMLRSGQAYAGDKEAGKIVVIVEQTVAASPSPVPVVLEESALKPGQADDFEFQVPDEVDNMNLEEHGIFSVDSIPDPDQSIGGGGVLFSTEMLQSPLSDNTPCSSNGNTPPYASPNNSPTSSAAASPSKRHHSHSRKRQRINVNSKRITKQIVQNNLKLNHLYLESSVLPSYTEWSVWIGGGKKSRKLETSNGPWR